MLDLVEFLLGLYIVIFGCCIGSFLNVLIFRIPKQIPFWRGRSYCPSCGTVIRPLDMIPVISYLALRGKCRKCNNGISRRYPLVEALTGLIALLVYWGYGISFLALVYFTFAAVLTAIAFIDIDTMTIPDGLIIALAVPTLLSPFFVQEIGIIPRIIGLFIISVPMFLLTFVIPDGFGGGDIKLLAVAGFMLGWQNTLVAFLIGLVIGGIHGVILLIKDKNNKGRHIAFGQYLAAGIFISLLYGDGIINGYLTLFGLK